MHRSHNPLPARSFQYDFQGVHSKQERNGKEENGSHACPGVGPRLNLHFKKINIGRRVTTVPPTYTLPRLADFLKRQAIKTLEENKVEGNGLWVGWMGGGVISIYMHVIPLWNVK